MGAGGGAAYFSRRRLHEPVHEKRDMPVVISGLPDRYNGGVQIPPQGSSVLFHGEDFDHMVGVIAQLCLAEPGNTEVTFAVNIGKFF
jgi:hypothetical protein